MFDVKISILFSEVINKFQKYKKNLLKKENHNYNANSVVKDSIL